MGECGVGADNVRKTLVPEGFKGKVRHALVQLEAYIHSGKAKESVICTNMVNTIITTVTNTYLGSDVQEVERLE
jgi:hypothetical protein